MEIINSDSYWNTRFVEDWESFQGPAQSRFFARLAIEHLPRWLIEQLQRQPLTLADWGCAQGDGTDVWASYVDSRRIIGVDFSSVAIEQAEKRYPTIRFINEDWLTDQPAERALFDVVFSSNTLEHFHRPYDVLNALCDRATKALVLALPYRELDRHQEHFYTFLPDNIPATVGGKFRLTWSRVVDCREFPHTLWGGEQIILVYAESNWVGGLGLTLRDLCVEQTDSAEEIAHLNQIMIDRDGQIASLNQTVADRDGQVASLNQVVIDRDGQLASLNQAVIDRDVTINNMLMSNSWRVTQPLRLLRQLGRTVSFSQFHYDLLKSVYWRLPEIVRIKLNKYRYQYVAKHLYREKELGGVSTTISASTSNKDISWVKRTNTCKKIAIIPCAFEFDELVNQRPINAAKYYSENGFLVLFIAWQWHPAEELKKGSGEVFPGVLQIPMYEFIEYSQSLVLDGKTTHYLVTLPSRSFIEITDTLRQQAAVIFYDIMDEWEEFYRVGQAPWFDKSLEKNLVLKADFVTAVSPALKEKFSDLRTDIFVIGNGYSPSVLGEENKGVAGTAKGNKTVVGYFGHLTDSWFDWHLLFYLAEQYPSFRFEIIGYGEPDWVREKISISGNVLLLGKIQPSELHKQVSCWSVGIIPFIQGKLADAVDPIKIYEYLYFGLPVVVTGIPHLHDYPRTYFACKDTIVNSLERALNDDTTSIVFNPFLERTTWQARFKKLMELPENQRGIWSLYGY